MVHGLQPAPGHAEVPPGAVMGGVWQIPPQVNVPLFTQAGRRVRNLCACTRVCVCVCVCSLSCAKPPQPHGAGSSSGGLHQTKPLCSTPLFQPSTAPPSPSHGVCQHAQASRTKGVLQHQVPLGGRWEPRLGSPQHHSSVTLHCLRPIVRAHSTKAQLN